MQRKENISTSIWENELLKRYIRVSIGSKEAMKKFLDAFLELDK